jgi:hypothetical protein
MEVQKNNNNRNVMILLVVVLLLFFAICFCIFAFLFMMASVPIKPKTTPSPTIETPFVEETEPVEYINYYKVGDEVTLGEYALTIHNVERTEYADNINLIRVGRSLYALDLEIENLTNQPFELLFLGYYVVDEKDNIYSLNFDIVNEPLLEMGYMLEPREKIRGWAGVEVDEDSQSLWIEKNQLFNWSKIKN